MNTLLKVLFFHYVNVVFIKLEIPIVVSTEYCLIQLQVPNCPGQYRNIQYRVPRCPSQYRNVQVPRCLGFIIRSRPFNLKGLWFVSHSHRVRIIFHEHKKVFSYVVLINCQYFCTSSSLIYDPKVDHMCF
jgi:hypothetical protein